jgi:hypothetical protein
VGKKVQDRRGAGAQGFLAQRFDTRVTLDELERAFARARQDLYDVGLLDEGVYLDRIDCYLAWLPERSGELGFVYDGGVPWMRALMGYEPGVIYVPPNAPAEKHVPGGTLLDTVRHELGHAWAWLDRAYFRRPWFAAAFGAPYWKAWPDGQRPPFDRHCFVSDYATESSAEDFCETFMCFLKYRRSLERFSSAAGLHRKLRAVERAVAVATRERAPHVRGPRT